jgi:hypothetical protein
VKSEWHFGATSKKAQRGDRQAKKMLPKEEAAHPKA